jgi:hypothetical protein
MGVAALPYHMVPATTKAAKKTAAILLDKHRLDVTHPQGFVQALGWAHRQVKQTGNNAHNPRRNVVGNNTARIKGVKARRRPTLEPPAGHGPSGRRGQKPTFPAPKDQSGGKLQSRSKADQIKTGECRTFWAGRGQARRCEDRGTDLDPSKPSASRRPGTANQKARM